MGWNSMTWLRSLSSTSHHSLSSAKPSSALWLKTFDVEPKMIEGRQAECGGAVISKRADAPWLEGSFQEELGLWQQEWFYITAPRGSRQKPPPPFRSGPPRRLMSWVNQG